MDKGIQWVNPATRFIKVNSPFFNANIEFKTVNLENKDEFISLDISPTLQGTMLDILFSWILNENIVIDKYKIFNHILNQNAPEHVKKFVIFAQSDIEFKNRPEVSIYKMSLASAHLTHAYRSSLINDSINSAIKILNSDEEVSKNELEKFNILFKRIKSRVMHIKKQHIVDNPIFGTRMKNGFLMKADGDYLYDKTLGDLKSSKYNKITKDYIRQLLFYKYLNNIGLNLYEIDNLEIFNPLWNSIWTCKINDIKHDFEFLDE